MRSLRPCPHPIPHCKQETMQAMTMAGPSASCSFRVQSYHPSCVLRVQGRKARIMVQANKGFAPETEGRPQKASEATNAAEQPSTSTSSADASIEDIEARLKSRRAARRAKTDSQVKVQSAVVDQATGKSAPTPASQAETTFVSLLSAVFLLILVEGLVLAGSGFMPNNVDLWVQDYLYPSYTPQVLGFLGMSTLYGLFKIGALPGQKQQQ